MQKFSFKPNLSSGVSKVQQLVDALLRSINYKMLLEGDPLPSVNDLMKESGLSRDTVFKSYSELKRRGIVEAIPNKGYFVTRSQKKVFLFLDTFKAYKEVLYNSFKQNLPKNTMVDINFHHYNFELFKSIIHNSNGKFNSYVIMNFNHPEIPGIIQEIDPEKLLLIDWAIHSQPDQARVYQDFGESVYNCLASGWHLLRKYDEVVCVYPEYTFHPFESVEQVNKFCTDNHLDFSILYNIEELDIKVGKVYFVFEDIDLASILEQANRKKFRLREDFGLISYNDTPMKQFIADGITVISTDFKLMGKKSAEFAESNEKIDFLVPTELIIRESL
ncbi:MAG TPA: GntR family transcriptional regulator [Prolixibacteraceae bacterium]|nr:GntR family transcriptional regulator [Prolixibacteraceae bacterium]